MRIKRESVITLGFAGVALLLSGCAHKEQTAPCDPLAVVASTIDCGPERAINVVTVIGGGLTV